MGAPKCCDETGDEFRNDPQTLWHPLSMGTWAKNDRNPCTLSRNAAGSDPAKTTFLTVCDFDGYDRISQGRGQSGLGGRK